MVIYDGNKFINKDMGGGVGNAYTYLKDISEYLYEICSLFNKFYSECNIVNENDVDKKNSYIALLRLIYNTCSKLLDILAINIPEKM